jgi:DNA polymerase III subunit delta'
MARRWTRRAGEADAGALAALSGGSVGEALRLVAGDGLTLYARIVALMAAMPGLPRPDLIRLADSAAGRGAEARFDLIVRLTDLALARLARGGATRRGPGPRRPGRGGDDRAAGARCGGGAGLGGSGRRSGRRGRGRARAVNLDPAALVIDMFLRMERAARSLVR